MFAIWHRGVRTLIGGAVTALVCAAMVTGGVAPASGQGSYFLYYSLDIPLATTTTVLDDSGFQQVYTGTFRGTLGGLPVTSSALQYRPGPTKVLGGGTFSLTTPAGTVRDGHILMSTDGPRTTLLFFGVYLGTHLEFSATSDREQVGGAGTSAAGLARTGFVSHDEYRDAILKATASVAPAARDQILVGADTNLQLVTEYQQKTP
jgi:hypothetical protein